MTSEVQKLLKDCDRAFRSGDRALYSTARANLKRGIRAAKLAYKGKIEDYVMDNNPRQMWQGLQHLTNYKGSKTLATTTGGNLLVEEFNNFFAHFETKRPITPSPLGRSLDTSVLTVQQHEVRRALRAVNPRKAASPDRVPGKVLRACCDELSAVFTSIFNLSLLQATVPSSLKSAIIIPVPKKSSTNCLADYRPVALTPLIMKCFKRL
ncbi:hypothetical protein LDENG_00118790, partial [Lucifuga dentata]